MAKKATTVEDVVLGEAKAGSFEDMVAIASVIENRSRQLGKSYKDVVSVQAEFNAYNKALPPGVESYRSMARQAIEQVKENGPVHNATFYATPAATKNLPSGLTPVTSTVGHQFFADPQMRSIRTVDGFVKPSAAAAVPNSVPTPTSRPSAWRDPLDVAGNIPGTMYDVAGATVGPQVASLPDIGPTPSARPSNAGLLGQPETASLGLGSLSPSFNAGMQGRISSFDRTGLSQGAQSLASALDEAGFGNLGVNSGYRSPERNARVGGARDSQHTKGNALDLETKSLTDFDKSRVLDAALSAGAKGIGAYNSGTLHVDTRANPSFWGPNAANSYARVGISQMPGWAQDDLRAMVSAGQFGYLPSGINNNVPTPSPRAEALAANAVRDAASFPGRPSVPGSMPAAVERSMLGGAPASILGDISMPSQQPSFSNAVQAASQATASFPGRPAPSIGSMPAAPSPSVSMDQATAVARDRMSAPAAAASPDIAAAYKDMANTMGQVGVMAVGGVKRFDPLSGMMVGAYTPPPSVTRIAAPTPAAVPAAVVAPPAPVQRQSPISRPAAAIAAPRSATGADVWGGRATSGIATNGNQMTRNPDGSVSMTSSKYGYTETMNPDGSYKSTTAPGLFGIDRAANSLLGGIGGPSISGPLSGQGIKTQAPQQTGMMNSRAGKGVRGVVGGVAGGMAGGLLGPLGSMLGAAIGADLAQGKNPFGNNGMIGGLLGGGRQQGPNASGYWGGGYFPDRPSAGAAWGGGIDGGGVNTGVAGGPSGSGRSHAGEKTSSIGDHSGGFSVDGPGGLY